MFAYRGPEQNGRNFGNDISKCIVLKENFVSWFKFHRRLFPLSWHGVLHSCHNEVLQVPNEFHSHENWASCQIRKIAVCACVGNVFPPPRISDPDMHYGTCVHDTCRDRKLAVSVEVGGGENVSGMPGACATGDFTCLVRGPCRILRLISKATLQCPQVIFTPISQSYTRTRHISTHDWIISL